MCFVSDQGNWLVFGMVVKLIKNVVKHEAPCAAVLSAGGETVKLLLGVARLVSRMPDQRKLLKVRISSSGASSSDIDQSETHGNFQQATALHAHA